MYVSCLFVFLFQNCVAYIFSAIFASIANWVPVGHELVYLAIDIKYLDNKLRESHFSAFIYPVVVSITLLILLQCKSQKKFLERSVVLLR